MFPLLLKPSFFGRPALVVARDLLGKYLVRQIGKKKIAGLITETEAYIGPHDLASHSSKGRTKRTEIMFKEGGHWYVYFVYGMHYMVNVVTDGADYPSAVLIRGVERVSGPGRVAKHFKINKKLNGTLVGKKSGLWIEDRGLKISKFKIKKSPRIGVAYAGPIWATKDYRFFIKP